LCDQLARFSDFPDGNYQIPKIAGRRCQFCQYPKAGRCGYMGVAVKLRGEK